MSTFFHIFNISKFGISFRLFTLKVVAYFHFFLKIPIKCLTTGFILEQKKCDIFLEHLYTLQHKGFPWSSQILQLW